jgi:hypothetical protein
MEGLTDAHNDQYLIVPNKPLEWTGLPKLSVLRHRFMPATQGQRYIQKPFPTMPSNCRPIRYLLWHSDVWGEFRQRLLDGSVARIPSQGLGASSSWHHR